MPAQAPTPRTTRNSRGLRSTTDSLLGDSARVSRRRRSSGTPTSASLERALSTSADPATPTPRARFAQPSPLPTETPALEAIPEEQQQVATPTLPSSPAVARRPIYPPPVVLAPATPYAAVPLPSSSSPLEHPRVTAIRNTPTRSARRNASPRTPSRFARYITRFIDATPSKSPAVPPKSPGSETCLFKQRREQEGEEKFARELWIAIRNDHYMRGCWCGPPNIYNSREEAEEAAGHLRFYVVGPENNKNLRVLQKKDDLRWHCICGNNDLHAVYRDLINSNGKRPAEDSEIDLVAQTQDSKRSKSGQSISRVIAAPIESDSDDEEQSPAPGTTQAETQAPAQSMWAQARGIFSRAVATMGSPIASLIGTLRAQFHGDSYETIDIRQTDTDNDTVTVKRLKRQAPASPTEQPSSGIEDDGFDDLVWTDDPTKHIGLENLQHLGNIFVHQYKCIKDHAIVFGPSIETIRTQIQDGEDLETSIALHEYREQQFGSSAPEQSSDDKAAQCVRAKESYIENLGFCIQLLHQIYDQGRFEDLKTKYPTPPLRLPLGKSVFRQSAGMAGRFLSFLLTLDRVMEIDKATRKAIAQMIADANAIHKQEMLPSFIEQKHDPTENMPGYFPEDKVSAIEEVPAGEIEILPLYDVRYPEPETSNEEEQIRPGDYKLVPNPKGILKPSKEWHTPSSPRYVATPKKDRKLSFISPVHKFIPPKNIPSKVMTPQEAERIAKMKLAADVIGDEHSIRMFEATRTVSRQQNMSLGLQDQWNLEALERDDQEMGLTYHARKYDGFLSDLQDDLVKRAEQDEENRTKLNLKLTPRRREVRIPLPPLPSTPEMRQRSAHLLEDDTSSPATSSPVINPLSRPRVEEQAPKPVKKPTVRTLEEFFAEDDDIDFGLPIATEKLDQLHLDRQIQDEFESGVRRAVEEKRKREEEEALRERERRLEEERRQREEERRREQAARRQREAEEYAALTGLRAPTRPFITPLSSDWEVRVNNAANANPQTELVKTLEGQPLTRRDFEEKLLPPTAWLNDNVIIGSILHIADYINKAQGATDQEPKCAAFTSYFWPRLLSNGAGACGRLLRRAGVRKANLLDIDTILIPICAQSHWTLAVIRPGKRTVAHIDSMRGGRGDDSVKSKLLELVRFILEDQFVECEWRAVDYEGPRQTNGWDCGVFTITNAMCMALELNPRFTYTERELTLQRRRLAAMLLNEGFKGDFSLDGF